MINIYKYTFYRMYTWQLKNYGAEDVPAYKAVLIVSIFASLNLLTIGLLLKALGLISFDVSHLQKLGLILLYFGVIIYFYLSFAYGDKYKIIVKNYKKETLKERNINSVLVLFWMIASSYIYMFFGLIVNWVAIILK